MSSSHSEKCLLSQETRDVGPILAQFWRTVYDVRQTMSQHGMNVLCLLGLYLIYYFYPYVVPLHLHKSNTDVDICMFFASNNR